MTKERQRQLLYNLNLLKTIGYEYCDAINLNSCNSAEDFKLPNNLNELNMFVQNCSICDMSKSRTRVDFAEGNPHSKIVFVDLQSSILEDGSSSLVVGKSGELLIKMIESVLGVPYRSFYFTNIIKCKTSLYKEPNSSDINSCRVFLDKQLELIKPKLIVSLGDSCFYTLMNTKTNFEHIRGKITKYHGVDLLPIHHPSFLLRNPSCKKDAFTDMLKIKTLLESM